MKAEIRLPTNFTLHCSKGTLYSNFDHELNLEVAEEIKNKPLAAEYIAHNFHGSIWWNEEIGYWCIEISQNKLYKGTYISEEISFLINEVQDIFGRE